MPRPATAEEFLIRSRELAAAQRLGLLPPPGKIGREPMAKALGMSPNTAKRHELTGLLKLRDALERDGLNFREVLRLISQSPES